MTERPPAAPATRRPAAFRHLVLSAALWVTYLLYWKVVLSRGVQREAPLSLGILGGFVLLQLLVTNAWIVHNRRIWRRDRRRDRPPADAPPVTDFLARRLSTWPPDSDLTRASCVVVRIVGPEKRFEAGLRLGSTEAHAPPP
jgi:hypothetical protein